VEPEPSPLTRSPFATTSTVAASWWPSSSGTGQANSSATDSAEPTAEETQSAEEAPTAEGASTAASDQPGTEAPASTEEAEPDALADWPSFPTYATTPPPSPSSWDSPQTAEATDSAPSPSGDLAAAVDQMAGEGEAIALGAPADFGESGGLTADATESETAARSAEPAAEMEPASSAAQAAQPADGDPLARARTLLDELGALLPSLTSPAAPAATGSPVDVAAVAAGLTAARDEAVGQQGQLDALMAVVETAKSRPRDIDVMLDLARQVEGIVALKSGYDRCREAIESALGQLGSRQNG
jgi:hypothetical protein